MPLTQDQLDSFHREGYLRYGKILDDVELDPLRKEYDRVFGEGRRSTARYNNLKPPPPGSGRAAGRRCAADAADHAGVRAEHCFPQAAV